MSLKIDIGRNHSIQFVSWAPDRQLNPQFAGIPDDARAGAKVYHPNLKNPAEECVSYIGLNPALNTDHATWTVEGWEPLTISPSLLCTVCGDHGFIRQGKWVPA